MHSTAFWAVACTMCLLASTASACSLRQLLSGGCGGAATGAKTTGTPVYMTAPIATRVVALPVSLAVRPAGAVVVAAKVPATTTTPAAAKPAATAATTTAAAQPAGFATITEAVGAAAKAPNLSTLMAVINAAGVAGALKPDTAWTIFAPTNEAFESRIKKDLGVTPAELLKSGNKEALVKVLSYHVIPSAAVTSGQLKDGQTVATALEGAAPLKVSITTGKEGKPVVQIIGATNTAQVTVADVKAGKSVIHVVDDVLLPAGVGKATDTDK